MSRPTRAIIDIPAFVENYRHARSLTRGARAVAVIKADAYGHGAVVLAKALSGTADAFGVACIEEAMELRESGITDDIVLLEGIFEPHELIDVTREHLTQVVHCAEQLQWVLEASPARPYRVWLKLDSGMHRLGFEPDAFRAAFTALKACAHVGEIVLMSHFSRADEVDNDRTRDQFALFQRLTADLDCPISVANSPAVLAWPATHGDWIRPGIMLYGASPMGRETPTADPLRPVMRLESAVIAVRTLATGEPIGYGGRFTCDRPTRVGVVAIGYGDGYPRHAIDGTPVAIDGVRSRIIGRVSMDMLTVDLTPVQHAGPGSRVELWGPQVSANTIARHSDTIAYELFTGVTRRVPRLYQSPA